ncbi:MAG: hypothetical protein Ct9H300mP11_32940 [Chloroflexota bacterium]|nr:MAG: hypothetical protein Ct9H300mP11_32940 [Chloroflexota bacterium]
MWYRIRITLPEEVNGHPVSGTRVQFETCIDDYGEIWMMVSVIGTGGQYRGSTLSKEYS